MVTSTVHLQFAVSLAPSPGSPGQDMPLENGSSPGTVWPRILACDDRGLLDVTTHVFVAPGRRVCFAASVTAKAASVVASVTPPAFALDVSATSKTPWGVELTDSSSTSPSSAAWI